MSDVTKVMIDSLLSRLTEDQQRDILRRCRSMGKHAVSEFYWHIDNIDAAGEEEGVYTHGYILSASRYLVEYIGYVTVEDAVLERLAE